MLQLTNDLLLKWMEEAQLAVNSALEKGKPFIGSMNYADLLVADRSKVEWMLRERLFASCLMGREVNVDHNGINI